MVAFSYRKIARGEVFMKMSVFKYLPLFALAAGCTAFRVAGDVETGRTQLLIGNPESALPYFQKAADMNPNYVKTGSYFQEGVWTYVGRTLYALGNYSDARRALERAAQNPNDYLAKLYLGLATARAGDQQQGLQHVNAGMTELYNWLEYIQQNTTYGTFWDPRREIRSEIDANRRMIAGKDIDWQRLYASGEWIGKKTEEEIDWVRRDERSIYNGDGKRSMN
jgi:tetratricopeptide (TPR) repeat protein